MTLVQTLAGRYRLTLDVIVESPLRVGADSGTGALDLPCLRAGSGSLVVPGTSIAGVLRHEMHSAAWATSSGDGADTQVDTWFGPGDAEDGPASRVWVADVHLPDAVVVERRGVGIDRVTGTAAPEYLYSHESIEPGARGSLELTIDYPTVAAASGALTLLATLHSLLSNGVAVGAKTSSGYGVLRAVPGAETPSARHLAFSDREATLSALDGGTSVSLPPPGAIAESRMDVTFPFVALGPLMVRSDADGNAVDDLPLVTSVIAKTPNDAASMADAGSELAFVLPGSAVKGTLRSHAGRIVRTVLGIDIEPITPGDSDSLNEQINAPLVAALFGSAATDGRSRESPGEASAGEQRSELPGQSAVTVHQVVSQVRFPQGLWDQVITMADPNEPGSPGPLSGPTDDPDQQGPLRRIIAGTALDGVIRPATHVAIDRWTGAPSHGALFTTLEVRTTWEPLKLEVDLPRLERACGDPDQAKAAIVLLMFVLRDLADGLVPLGFATNRGQGSVEFRNAQTSEPPGDGMRLRAAGTLAGAELNFEGHPRDITLSDDFADGWTLFKLSVTP